MNRFHEDAFDVKARGNSEMAYCVLLARLLQMLCFMFSRHYADNLDGCGLNLEGKVRRAYYALVRRCLEGVKCYHSQDSSRR